MGDHQDAQARKASQESAKDAQALHVGSTSDAEFLLLCRDLSGG